MPHTNRPGRRAASAVSALGALIALLVAPTLSTAHERVSAAAGPVSMLDIGIEGLLDIELPGGRTLLTHGDDPPVGAGGSGVLPSAERAPVCGTGSVMHVLYGHPVGRVNRSLLVGDQLRAAVRGANGALNAAAMASGPRQADLRVACGVGGSVLIDSFVNAKSASFADVVAAAMTAGFKADGRNYTIFYDDPTSPDCGWGSVEVDDRLAMANANNGGGAYSVLYPGCWDAETVLHETAHNLGAVQPSAPHATGAGHCSDENDVLCYDDGSGAAMSVVCSGEASFDCGFDDYFDAAPEPGEYLATHWNLGSPLNRFMQFSEAPVVPEVIDPDVVEDPDCPGARVEDGFLVCDDDLEADEPEFPVRIVRGSVRLAGDGRVRLRLACPAARWVACEGTLRLERPRGGSLGRTAFRMGVGRRRTVRVALTSRARHLVAQRSRLVVRASAVDPLAERAGRARAVLRAPGR